MQDSKSPSNKKNQSNSIVLRLRASKSSYAINYFFDPASSIQHRASSIEYRESRIENRESRIEHRVSSIEHRVSSIYKSSKLLLIIFSCNFQFSIPFRPILPNKRIFQKFIYRHFQTFSKCTRRTTNIPAIIIHCFVIF